MLIFTSLNLEKNIIANFYFFVPPGKKNDIFFKFSKNISTKFEKASIFKFFFNKKSYFFLVVFLLHLTKKNVQ